MNELFALRRLLHRFGICALLFAAISSQSDAQLAGTFHSAPGTLATYVYHHGEYESVMLPADITVTFSGDTPTSMLTATIHQPIIGDVPGDDDYPVVNYFPLVVTGNSSDGRDFEGELLANSQYYFDWQFEPAEQGRLKWEGQVSWVGGRIEISTINEGARLIPSVAGDYDQDGDVDAADYVVWRDALEQGGPGRADGDHNGLTDAADYEVWRTHFGQLVPTGEPPTGAIPEPPTLMFAAVAVAWYRLYVAQRRTRSVFAPRGSIG
jgi:hypothetical protein